MSKKRSHNPNRRAFLRASLLSGGAAALALAGCKSECSENTETEPAPSPTPTPEPQGLVLPDNLEPRNFHVHNEGPLALETRRYRFGASVITPAALLFVRNNLPMPDASIVENRSDWELEIAGVTNERTVTLRELRTWGIETITMVMQCSGNGRRFFEHAPSGSPWGVGAAGCTMWTGVPVRTVVERLGGAIEGLAHFTATGGEELPEGVDRDSVIVERSIPRDKALDDCLLAWEMNGEPIPLTHGGPLRLIVPGYFGCNQIKYVKRVAFTAEQTSAAIMSHGYRFRPIGEEGDQTQPSMWEMPVKSWINNPSGDFQVARGMVQIHGVAFSGGHGVDRVEVSIDGGETWEDARFVGPAMGKYAWRPFVLEKELDLGAYTLASRATDKAGNTQPEHRVENHRGYGNSSWRDAAVSIEVVDGPVLIEEIESEYERAERPAPGSIALNDEQASGRQLFTEDASPACATCHTLSEADTAGTVGPNLDDLGPTEAQIISAVTDGVGAMPGYSVTLTEEQIRQIAAYVSRVTR